MTPTRYERIRVDGRTIYLRNPVEVDVGGDELAPAGTDERRHIIGLDLVTRRTVVVMDRKYGTLVEE